MMPRTRREPTILVFFSAVAMMSLLRLALLIIHNSVFRAASLTDLAAALLKGVMVDSSVAATTLFLIELLTLLARIAGPIARRRIRSVLIALCFGLFFFVCLADIAYFGEYDSRMNILVLENMNQMGPVIRTILGDAPVWYVFVAWVATLAIFWWGRKQLSERIRWPWFGDHPRLAFSVSMILLAGFSFLWVGQPFWRMRTFAVSNQALNQLSLNGVYTLLKAAHQKSVVDGELSGIDYQFQSLDYALERVRSTIIDTNEVPIPGRYPLARRVKQPRQLACEKPNIVLILMEGFSASYVGRLCPNGEGYSPGFDSLASQGIFFTNFYGHETRTHHGLVSTVGSFPSVLGLFITRRRGTDAFYTLGTLLKNYGYRTGFIYGYDAGYDNMGFFLQQGGFDHIVDEDAFPEPRFRSKWGVSDEDLFDKAHQIFSAMPSEVPFLYVVLTSSNHTPHAVPEHFARMNPQFSYETRNQAAFAYADYALKQYLDSAANAPYFKNTIFVMVADHGEIRDPDDRQFKRFHIPCLIYAPHLITEPRVISTVAGQVDIATTLVHLIGYPGPYHFVGRNLLTVDSTQGFALMRNDQTVYYRVGDRVLMRDLRDTLWEVLPVDSLSRMTAAESADDTTLGDQMNHEMECYLQVLYHLFCHGQHRCPEQTLQSW